MILVFFSALASLALGQDCIQTVMIIDPNELDFTDVTSIRVASSINIASFELALHNSEDSEFVFSMSSPGDVEDLVSNLGIIDGLWTIEIDSYENEPGAEPDTEELDPSLSSVQDDDAFFDASSKLFLSLSSIVVPTVFAQCSESITITGTLPFGWSIDTSTEYTVWLVYTPCDDGEARSIVDGTCEQIDDCASNPCENDGICSDGVNAFECECSPGFAGDTCTEQDFCHGATPCGANGACSNGDADFTCECDAGYSGETCEVDIDECASNPCTHGTCSTPNVASYECECDAGYSGDNCEVDIDECAPEPCDHGTCATPNVNSYECTCETGWTGDI
jgi:hypothetical protein